MPSAPEKANADRKRRYYEQHERELERSRAYYASHPRSYDPAVQRARYETWKTRNPDGLWQQWLKAGHDMRPEQWFTCLLEQDGKCYLCEQPLPDDRSKVAIDHDHSCCGKKRSCIHCRRGLAHMHCNWLIGILDEDLERMRPVCSELLVTNFARAQADTRERIAKRPVQDALAAFAAE